MVRSYGIEFFCCDKKDCQYCRSQQPTARKLLQVVRDFHGHLPTPVLHVGLPGHYQTLLQVLGPLRNRQPLVINRGLPSLDDPSTALCERGCNMMCLSAASKKRHDVLFHYDEQKRDLRRKRKHRDATDDGIDSGPPKKVWWCGFDDCSFSCSTSYQLRMHKEKEQHKRACGQPAQY